jgi:hypothetical protein
MSLIATRIKIRDWLFRNRYSGFWYFSVIFLKKKLDKKIDRVIDMETTLCKIGDSRFQKNSPNGFTGFHSKSTGESI